MKEATGELNMTVITVVAVAAIAAFFTMLVWPSVKDSLMASTICANGHNYTQGINGQDGYVNCGNISADNKFTCEYATTDDNGNIVNKTTTCQSK
ncbi:MAG: hypothetical protein ACI4OP_00925 [Candidatus Coprovivens sp.]